MVERKNDSHSPSPKGLVKATAAVLTGLVVLGLGWALLDIPLDESGLAPVVSPMITASGVEHPVTAVLLNFRAYDTLLEIGVLFLAALSVWALKLPPLSTRHVSPSPLLLAAVRLLVPAVVLIAGYLLWLGSHAPGGAFQAGAVLGAGGVLLVLSGLPVQLPGPAIRWGLSLGFLVFLVAGILALFWGGHFLEYPPGMAYGWILTIEFVAALSIGVTLTLLWVGRDPSTPGDAVDHGRLKGRKP